MVDLSVYTNHRMGDMYYNRQGETLLFSCSWIDFVSETLEMDLTSVQHSS